MNLNRFFKKAALTLVVTSALGLSSAMATTFKQASGAGSQSFSAGVLGDLWLFAHAGIAGAFTDTISFNLPQAANFGFTSLTHYMGMWSDITSFSISLDGAALDVASYFNTEVAAGQMTLADGAHELVISGVGSGAMPINGGSYQLQMSATPVPEPESWALLLGGLGLVGLVARRKEKNR